VGGERTRTHAGALIIRGRTEDFATIPQLPTRRGR
jgi:hypothetical protein